MNLQLKKLRTLRGLSQEDMAKELGIKKSRYGTWERGERTMSFPQAVACAEILNCTTDALAGRSVDDRKLTDPYEQELVDCYRSSTVDRQERILDTARDAAAMSKDAAECDLPASQEVSA